MSDGGYYAIKGFAFQFDRTILEILNATDDQDMVSLENIQDINTDSFVMQVKYRESQDFSEGKIREPVLQLIEEYSKATNRQYVLYCHFRDKGPGAESVDLGKLNKILTPSTGKTKKAVDLNRRIAALSQQTLRSFCNSFQISYAPDYDSQFESVLNSLMKLPYVRSEELAVVLYSTIVEYLKDIVISTQTPLDRKTCRKDVLDRLGRGKRLVFGAALEEYKGTSAYIALVKKEFVSPTKNQQNLFIMGNPVVDEGMPIGALVASIVEYWFKRATHDVEPPTFVVPDAGVVGVKKFLLQEGIRFNDGFESIEFTPRLLREPPVRTRKSVAGRASDSLDRISFKVRLVSLSSLRECASELSPRMVVYFDTSREAALELRPTQQISGLSTKNIHDLVCR